MSTRTYNKWTEAEIALLKKLRPTTTLAKLQDIFKRNRKAIVYKSEQLGLTSNLRRWSADEIAYIRKNIDSLSVDKIALFLGRSVAAVHSAMARCRINRPRKSTRTAPKSSVPQDRPLSGVEVCRWCGTAGTTRHGNIYQTPEGLYHNICYKQKTGKTVA